MAILHTGAISGRRWGGGVLAALCFACGGDASRPGASNGGTGGMSDGAGADGDPSDDAGPLAPIASGPSSPGAGPPAPPRELRELDPGSFQMTPATGICPEGTRALEPAFCQPVEKRSGGPRSPCVCEYECSPACGSGEVCSPDAAAKGNACQCHPAMVASAEGCAWPGLLENATFEDDAGWRLWTSGASGASTASIAGGQLELGLGARCAYAWAATPARLPPRSLFPDGAALAFDYTASADVTDPLLRLSLGGALAGMLSPTARATERHCVRLEAQAGLALLEFSLEAYGVCAESLDIRLSLDNLRLEPEPSCG